MRSTVVRRATTRIHRESILTCDSVPIFLCPALLRPTLTAPPSRSKPHASQSFSSFRRNRQEAALTSNGPSAQEHPSTSKPPLPAFQSVRNLPFSCPGCGAPSQGVFKDEAGYYDTERNAVKVYINHDLNTRIREKKEDTVFTAALQEANPEVLGELGLDKNALNNTPKASSEPPVPICERCHNLLHHRTGTSITHPSIESIRETIAESPHKRNHIYHVIDAADFPLSLVQGLQSALKIPRLRTRNRRALHRGWMSGDRIAEVSFIITRADLLAPLKEQVDKLMPYMQNVLRNALRREDKKIRLGNLYMVSAKRGWWTKTVKENIWNRGGAAWMVGKVNVGKSNLFEVVFPKGRGEESYNTRRMRSAEERELAFKQAKSIEHLVELQQKFKQEDEDHAREDQIHEDPDEARQAEEHDYDEESLLPPPQPYAPYPTLPLISSLPGTTAQPIRIPFGKSRGELIDLPGLVRTNPELSSFVLPAHRDDLVMKSRISARRLVLKSGQSLILGGGLVRITPTTDDLIFLVHPFVPIDPHVTSTEKAIGIQTQTRDTGVPSILAPGVGENMKSAGKFQLKWDVTRKLSGPLTSKMAGKMKPENLPFTIYSTDILIEGVGWVEIVAQMRRGKDWVPPYLRPREGKKDKAKSDSSVSSKVDTPNYTDALRFLDSEPESSPSRPAFPEIEVFSPLGKFIGMREPMSASVLGGEKQVSKRDRKARPRMSMKSVKARRKPGVKS